MSLLRIVHLSDIHIWRYTWDPRHLMSKRAVGIAALLRGRARKFRLERIADVVDRVRSLEPDHVLITGDLTTTALPAEFRDATVALGPLLSDPDRVTIVPGNHDRYTGGSVRRQTFENAFGAFQPKAEYPWLRWLDAETAILGLDATRSHISARGLLRADQLVRARNLTADAASRPKRLIVACHYPLAVPGRYSRELAGKRLDNAAEVARWLATVGRHLFCCGHVHAAWAFTPDGIPDQLCLNAGAPLLHDPTGYRSPGFLEITLDGTAVVVDHHAWVRSDWVKVPMCQDANYFDINIG